MGSSQSTEKKSPSKTVKAGSTSQASKEVEKTPEKAAAEEQSKPEITVSAPKTPTTISTTSDVDLTVTEEEMASIEAAATKIRDSIGGTSLEIVLSPAIKKVQA